jgi:hypothetical protein
VKVGQRVPNITSLMLSVYRINRLGITASAVLFKILISENTMAKDVQ